MMYMSFLVMVGLVMGLVAVAANPSPYFAALGLVLSAVCGCCLLMDFGVSFLSLVFLLVYLGGMLVVFAYSASLAAEPYPEAWGSWSVLMSVMVYMIIVVSSAYVLGVFELNTFLGVEGFDAIIDSCHGVGYMYIMGTVFLVISGFILLLTLFVVLEITRGVSSGSLRAV